jgi:hypothetical protein
MHRLQELVRLHRLGTGAREVARLLGLGPNTERRYREALLAAGVLDGSLDTIPALEELKAAVLQHAPPALPHQQQSSLVCSRSRLRPCTLEGSGGRQSMTDFGARTPSLAGASERSNASSRAFSANEVPGRKTSPSRS